MKHDNKTIFNYKTSTAFISLVLGWHSLVYAQTENPDPRMLLNEMSQAGRDLNYDGVFVYRKDNQIETMRIIHKSGVDGVSQRLVSLTGNAREVIRDNEEVKCYYPENKKVVVEKSRLGKLISAYLPSPVQSISEFYSFDVAGSERVAGKDSWIINIRPKDKYRYGYQLWIDKHSKLLLKSELKNQTGVTLEQILFAKLDVLDHIDDNLLKPNISATDYKWYKNVKDDEVNNSISNKQWSVTWMPTGFSKNDHSRQTAIANQMPVEHLVYSDGLAMVSIFVEKVMEKPESTIGSINFGGVNAYAIHANGYQITAVGEVPKTTVKKMADSVKALP